MESIISYAQSAAKFQKKIVFNAGVESSIDYINPSSNYVPKVSLLFSPFGLPFIPLEIIGSEMSSIISGMKWTKDRNNAGGICVVTITPDDSTINGILKLISKLPGGSAFTKMWNILGFSLEDLFKPMALCQLWIDGYHVMTGTVRSCMRSASVSNTSYSTSYTVTIDELGSLYNKNVLRKETIVLNGMELNITDSMTKAINLSGDIKGIKVQTAIAALVEAFMLSTLAEQGMSCSDGFPLAMRMMATPSPAGGMANFPYANNLIVDTNLFELNGGQSFWDFIKGMIPNPWMEFYTESGGRTIVTDVVGTPAVLLPGLSYIVSRSVPYTNPLIGNVAPAHIQATLLSNLNAITMLAGGDFVIVTDEDIHSKNLGFDCSNQYTSFRTTYSDTSMDINGKPIYSTGPTNPFASGGIKTFGVNEMLEQINCTNYYNSGTAAAFINEFIGKTTISNESILSKPCLSNLLALWFRNQSRFREGTIVTKLKAWARPGMYLLYLPKHSGGKPENARDIGIYYIDSLSHDYELSEEGSTATTVFNMIRGCPLPTSVASSALLLFDFESLPPVSGLWDGEAKEIQLSQAAINAANTA